jgi:glucose/arabinose dehydrogenase
MYVTVGSSTNATPEEDPRRAAIGEYNPDGSGHRIFAAVSQSSRSPRGSRNGHALDRRQRARSSRRRSRARFHHVVREGAFYRVAVSYIGRHVDPTVKTPRPDLVATAIAPTCCCRRTPRRWPPLYTGSQFPGAYTQTALRRAARLHHRSKLSGYSVVRIPFRNGKPPARPKTS